ncbi:hypothetical protein C5167_003087 [Papaver somniferum]|uniref:DUF4283 domain-containing protein n=2 Tax=Papaver somniferum TaxID=3469 RepID=A0A4Y7L3D1_PAPSO|nr:hypothetical protein C5167_003087 [Papaver somniferum]
MRLDQVKRDLRNKWDLQWNLEVRETRTKNLYFLAFEDPEEFARAVMSHASVDGKLLVFREKIDQVRHSYLNFNKYLFWTVFKFTSFTADRVYMARKVAKLLGEVLMMTGPHGVEYKALIIVDLTKPLVKKVDMVLEDLGIRKKPVEIDYIGLPARVCTYCMWIMHPPGYDCRNDSPDVVRDVPVVVGTKDEARSFLALKKNKAKHWKRTYQTSNEFRSLIDKKVVNRANGKRQRMDIDWKCPNPDVKARPVVIKEGGIAEKTIEQRKGKEAIDEFEEYEKERAEKIAKEKYFQSLIEGKHYLQGYAWLLAEYKDLGRCEPSEMISSVLIVNEGDPSPINPTPILAAEDVIAEDAVVSDKVKKSKDCGRKFEYRKR